MAARINKQWHFYVYELVNAFGEVQYIGKGSTRRLEAQKRNFSLEGHEVARFKSEKEAYAYEVKRIAECSPPLNKHPGGNGSKATKPVVRKTEWEKLYESLGSRKVCARLWLLFANESNADISKVDAIRGVAYG
jgi:hypothetical protein